MKIFKATIELLENSHFYYIITTGMDGNYSYVNTNYSKAFAHIDANVVGKPYHITMHPDDRKVCEQTAEKCFRHPDRSFPATIRKHDGKGGYIITQWEYRAIFDDNNEPVGVFCLGYDITQYAVANKQLEEVKSELEEKNTIIEEIYWEQSHVIRRPVANIIGLVSILSKMELDQNITNICTMLLQSTIQLDEAITSIVKKADQ
jgi:PAS domain S-box-containing protein